MTGKFQTVLTKLTENSAETETNVPVRHCSRRHMAAALVAWLISAFVTTGIMAADPVRPVAHHGVNAAAANLPDSITLGTPLPQGSQTDVIEESISDIGDSIRVAPVDTVPVLTAGEALAIAEQRKAAETDSTARAKTITDEWEPRAVEFNPDPTRAVWMSALFPGLGQVYNRRYWKLPIIVGGYLGLAYATNWNNTMLSDYTRAYRDLLDNDPDTRSYMDMFSPNVKEEDLDKNWLQNVLRSRKNYFRRNRDLCIIGMVGVYLLAMVDAYVDASLSHFDISPQLSMDVAPVLIRESRDLKPSIGLVWALNF